MDSLLLTTEKISEKYTGSKSYVITSENITITDRGLLSTQKNEFPFTFEGLDQFAQIAEIPKPFFRTLEPDLQSMIFNRRFQNALRDQRIPRDIRINLNQEDQIIGFDDPKLFRISPVKLMEIVASSLPRNLSAEKVKVARADVGTKTLQISCVSPDNITEPRPGDIINGGIDIVHHISGNAGTQIRCYLRRLVCSNGATAHICNDNKQLRVRRLNNGRFDENDMLAQIQRLLTEAWRQIDEKLVAVRSLVEKKITSLDFLEHERTRFSLNDRMLTAVQLAINEDEFGPTGTQFDIFNAISRVATHNQKLTFRQQRTLSRLAGEFSQQDVNKCDKCGSWVIQQN